MIKINISEEVGSVSDLVELLKNITKQIEEGFTSGANPYWNIIDKTQREEKIEYIKRIIHTFGMTSTSELELESSPVFQNLNGRLCSLVEEFLEDRVRVITYDDEMIINESYVDYEELSDDLIDEITTIIEDYEAEQIQTEKRISD